MPKRNGNHSSKTSHKEFIGAVAEEKPAVEVSLEVRDVLVHDAKMAQAVEQKVAAAVQSVVQAEVTSAASADRLVEMAASDLLKREADKARAEKASLEAQAARVAEKAKDEALSLKGRAVKAADSLKHKAEERLEKLPTPIRRVGQAIERTVAIVFWPARFGLRLAGELLRTPVAFARILLRSREA